MVGTVFGEQVTKTLTLPSYMLFLLNDPVHKSCIRFETGFEQSLLIF
jgi:hypothetical protein